MYNLLLCVIQSEYRQPCKRVIRLNNELNITLKQLNAVPTV